MTLSFIEPELWEIEFLHCGNMRFTSFLCSCDLDLEMMTFMYDLDPYSLEIHRMCKYELSMSWLLKIIL